MKNSSKRFPEQQNSSHKQKRVIDLTGPFSKEQLDLLYGKADFLVFLMKRTKDSYRYEYANPKCTEIFRKDLTGTLLDESMPAAVAEEIKNHYKIALDSQEFHTYRDYNLFTKDKLAIETELQPFVYGSGQYILAISRNVSKRQETDEVQLKNELKYTETVLRSYKDALNYAALVAIWELSGLIQFVNSNFKGLTGYESKELMGMHIADIGRSVISNSEYDEIRKVILSGEIWRGEIKCLDKSGEHFWVAATIIPMEDADGHIDQVLSIMFDITDRKQLEEQLHFMAYHDSLTGLPNRRMMVEQFAELKRQADGAKEWSVLLFIDGDDFKEINDKYGHDTGDEFIANFGLAIQKSIRKGDLAARMGGDEFLVALTGIEPEKAEEQIDGIVSRIKENLQEGWTIGGHHFSPTCSIGIAFYPNDAKDFETLVQKADAALYKAKEKGKNHVRFYEENWH